MAEPSGLGRIVAEGAEQARAALPVAPAAEQIGLDLGTEERFLEPDPSEYFAIAEQQGGSIAEAVQEWRRRGCRGRKPGAVNRAGAELADYLRQFGPDPLVAMMRMQARPVAVLAAELGCSPGDAWDRLARVRAELAPYLYGKKPVAVEFSGKGGMFMMAGMPGLDGELIGFEAFMRAGAASPGAAAEQLAAPIEYATERPSETVENQALAPNASDPSE